MGGQFNPIRRRDLLAVLPGGAVLAWTVAAYSQSAGSRPLVGALFEAPNQTQSSAFLDGMHLLGYAEGQNFDITYRFAGFDMAQLAQAAQQIVQLRPNVILTQQPATALAARRATASIPIVGAILGDPVRDGLAASEARPGGNVTGMLVQIPGLMGKQIEIAGELAPHHPDMLGVLVNLTNPGNVVQKRDLDAAAEAAQVKLLAVDVRAEADIEPAFKKFADARVQAVIVLKDGLLLVEASRIGALATAAHLPTVAGDAQWADAGLLISYGVNVVQNFQRAAYFVDRILKGDKPGDLPIEFPTKLEMVINLKTASALGITMPQVLMLQADRLIE